MSKRNIVILLLLFYGFNVFLTLNRHSKSGIQNYHSEIWADKGGYYIYLPAFLIYHFHAEKLPERIDKKTGSGFSIANGIIKTKYTYGVALLQSPFFIIAHLLSTTFGYENDGFSLIYHKMIDLAAVTYTFLALILLYLFLSRYVHKRLAFISVACIYLGTNLFYYSIFETGMSHIYSFFLFTCFLYLSSFILQPNQNRIISILFGIIVGLIIVVRPINVLFFPIYFILHQLKLNELKSHLVSIFLIFGTAIIILIPQFLYWKYSEGNYFFDSYTNENFSNLFSPKILNLWFSTNNGLLIYSPLVIFILAGIYYIKNISLQKRMLIGAYFLFISLVFASWHDWTYGCSYGCRPYVEYYSILALPFCYFLKEIETKKYLRFVFGFLIITTIVYNMKMVFSYDGCWYGYDWDWKELFRILTSKTK
ncbi:MAG: hypothetical protein ABI315_12260 [Bacteroidia bacterium]